MNKVCSICNIEKNISEFRFRSEKNVYMTYCRECEKDKNKKYKLKNKEKVATYNKQYMKKYNKNYYKENKEELLQYQTDYRINNIDKLKERDKIYYIKNKNNILKYQKEYRKEQRKHNISFKLKETISSYIRMSIKKNGESCLKYLPYSIKDLKIHLENQFESWMIWDNYGVYRVKTWNDNDQSTWTWQIDHIIPHSKFNYTSMEDQEFKDCWALSNLRPYSSKQNLLDGNRR